MPGAEGQVARDAIERRVFEVALGVQRPVGPAALDLLGQQVLGRAPRCDCRPARSGKGRSCSRRWRDRARQLDELLAAREARGHELLVGHGPRSGGWCPRRRAPADSARTRCARRGRASGPSPRRAAGRVDRGATPGRDRRGSGSAASTLSHSRSPRDRSRRGRRPGRSAAGPVPTRDSQTSSGRLRGRRLVTRSSRATSSGRAETQDEGREALGRRSSSSEHIRKHPRSATRALAVCQLVPLSRSSLARLAQNFGCRPLIWFPVRETRDTGPFIHAGDPDEQVIAAGYHLDVHPVRAEIALALPRPAPRAFARSHSAVSPGWAATRMSAPGAAGWRCRRSRPSPSASRTARPMSPDTPYPAMHGSAAALLAPAEASNAMNPPAAATIFETLILASLAYLPKG